MAVNQMTKTAEKSLTVLITGDTTTSGLSRSLDKILKQSGMTDAKAEFKVIDGDFNSWLREAVDPQSYFQQNQPDYWLQIWSPRALTDNSQIISQVKMFLSGIEQVMRQNPQAKSKILLTNFVVDPTLPQPMYQSLQLEKIARELNQMLEQFVAENSFAQLLNLQSVFTQYGLKNITDPRFEALGRLYFSPAGAEHIARFFARGIQTLRQTPCKVLVLDLDNTVWGGILGEDGAQGIKIGGEGQGYLFTRFQQAVLSLKKNGILLALCSKNNEDDALKVFKEHPDMVLKLEDISAYRINWEQKALNIRSMAEELNLGVNSFVFFDDSSFERENVRQLAPEVQVIEVPKDPSLYIQALHDFTGFDIFRVTDEDKKRAKQYTEEAKRKTLQKSSGSLEEFYRSLEMKATLSFADESNFTRVHQLIWKTNQFNLTTKRYEEAELRQMLASPNFEIMLLRLQDKMGESGITGVVILKKEKDMWEIENLMLSCRIIGRTVEFGLIRQIADRARQAGAQILEASFIPSSRNQVAAQYLGQSGFSLQKTLPDQTQKWSLNLSEAQDKIPADYVEMKFEQP